MKVCSGAGKASWTAVLYVDDPGGILLDHSGPELGHNDSSKSSISARPVATRILRSRCLKLIKGPKHQLPQVEVHNLTTRIQPIP